ncbi:MAG: phage portal protein [Oscillospiraceae bacterium]|nr:phage portal protein [Oscillospiraceae bacterium]
MGLFDKLFGRDRELTPRYDEEKVFRLLSGYTPVFHSWGGELYESELIRAAIDARARHISKLDVTVQGTAKPSLQNRLRLGPNEWQTWGQFMYRLSTILDMRNTALIVPVIDKGGDTTGIYPVLHSKVELVEVRNEPWIRITFYDGRTVAIELKRVGIMTKYQYRNDLFGESNDALGPTMDLLTIQNQGIEEGVKSAASYRFMATLANFSTDADLRKERERFTRENLEQGGGVLLWPNTYKDIKQIEAKPFIADADQVKLINENVYNYFGVNGDILQNKAIGDAWSAFYEGAIEPFCVQFSEVVTKMLFTQTERERGTQVMATSNRLQYMSNTDKLNVSAQMADRGLMTRDEIRQIWNLPPLPEGIGNTLPVRGEYYDLNSQGGNDE